MTPPQDNPQRNRPTDPTRRAPSERPPAPHPTEPLRESEADNSGANGPDENRPAGKHFKQWLLGQVRSAQAITYAISAGTALGLVVMALLGWVLASVSYWFINSAFDAGVYHHLTSFEPLSNDQLLGCYARALGRPPSKNETASKLAAGMNLGVFTGAYNEDLPPDQQMKFHQQAKVPVLEEMDASPQTNNVFTIVWWSQLRTNANPQPQKNAENPAEGKPPPGDNQIEELASDNAGKIVFAYAMEIRRQELSAGAFRLIAKYFPIVDEKIRIPLDKHKYTMLDRQSVPWLQLQPCAVNHSSGEMAQRFVDHMKRDVRGEDREDVRNAVLSDRKEKKKVELFIEQVLLRYLGRETPESRAKQGVLTDREFASLEELTAWPRRLNGSDFLGIIQFMTVAAFWMFVVAFIAKYRVILTQKAHLGNVDIFPPLGETIDPALTDEQIGKIQLERDNHEKATHGAFPCVPLEIVYAGYSAVKGAHGRYDAVPAFVETRANHLLERLSTGQWLLRFLAWVIPSVGFIGTVIGIGAALLGTGEVLSNDPLQQQGAIQSIASKLGTAFDTTFVALVLSIFGMFLLHLIQKQEEDLVQTSTERTLSLLIDPDKVQPPPKPAAASASVDAPRTSTPRPAPELKVSGPLAIDPQLRCRRRYMVDVVVSLFLAAALVVAATLWFAKTRNDLGNSIKTWVSQLLPSEQSQNKTGKD